MSKIPDSHQKRCPVCSTALPLTARRNQLYCTPRCSKNARMRRSRGKPIADPVAQPSELAALHATIADLQNRNRKLENLVAKLRQLNRRHRSQSQRSESAIATARRKEEMATATERRRQSETIATQLSRIEKLETENATLRNRTQDYEELRIEKEAANHFAQTQSAQFRTEIRKAQRTIAQLQAVAKVSAPILRDYQYFADRYFQTKARDLWDPSDSSRLQRLNAFRKASKGQQ